jgi:hypothetical protein
MAAVGSFPETARNIFQTVERGVCGFMQERNFAQDSFFADSTVVFASCVV